MNENKAVLVVDDDEVLRHGMRLILEATGFKVDEAGNGKEAKDILKQKTFELIISDVEMPVMDGVQLLAFAKQNLSARFLLVSDFSHALQARQAAGLGADHFLNKPFRKEDFLGAVEQALQPSVEEMAPSAAERFVPVPVTDFVTGSVLQVDLYVQISEQKFLKIGNRGGQFSPERAMAYQAKGVRWFHMVKEDFAHYVGFNISLAQMAHATDRIECSRKIRLTMHVTETLIAQLRQAGLSREQLENASNVVMNTVDLIATNPSTMKLLESMEVAGSLPSHSIAVAIWSCLLAKQLGWEGHSTFFRVAICALFHDVGEKELNEDLVDKPRFEMSKQERKVHESHTSRGRDILQSVPGMPEDVAMVALQHHELCGGGGYPYGLKLHQIHPLARLIGLADALCDLLKAAPPGKAISYPDFFRTLSQRGRDFDKEYLKALEKILTEVTREQSAGAAS